MTVLVILLARSLSQKTKSYILVQRKNKVFMMIWSMLSKLSVCFKTKFKFNSFNRNRNISNKVLCVIFGNNLVKNIIYHLLRVLLLISYFSYQSGIHVFRYMYQFQFHNASTVGY